MRAGWAGVGSGWRAAERARGTGWRSLSVQREEAAAVPLCARRARGGSAGSTRGNAGGYGGPGQTRLPPYPSLRLLGDNAARPGSYASGESERLFESSWQVEKGKQREAALREAGNSWAQHIALNSLKQNMGNFGQPKLSLEPRKRSSGRLHLPSRAARNGLSEK